MNAPYTPEAISKRNVAKLRKSTYLTSPGETSSPVVEAEDIEQRREKARSLMEQRQSGKWKMQPNVKAGKTIFVNGKKVFVEDEEDKESEKKERPTSTSSTPKKRSSILDRASTFGQVVDRKIPEMKPAAVAEPSDDDDSVSNDESVDSGTDEEQEEVANSIKEVMKSPASQKRNSFGRPLLYSPTYSPSYIKKHGRHVVKNGKRHSTHDSGKVIIDSFQNPLVA